MKSFNMNDSDMKHVDIAKLSSELARDDQGRLYMAGMRTLIELGIARGEIQQQGLTRFPQIVVAPAIVAVIWQGLFGRQAPLDAAAMLRVHLDLIFGERRTT